VRADLHHVDTGMLFGDADTAHLVDASRSNTVANGGWQCRFTEALAPVTRIASWTELKNGGNEVRLTALARCVTFNSFWSRVHCSFE
jgi:hypothetical protein